MWLKQHPSFITLALWHSTTVELSDEWAVAVCQSRMCVCVFTFGQDLWDLGVAGAEGAVDLEAIGIIQEWTTQGEKHFLGKQRSLLRFQYQITCQTTYRKEELLLSESLANMQMSELCLIPLESTGFVWEAPSR